MIEMRRKSFPRLDPWDGWYKGQTYILQYREGEMKTVYRSSGDGYGNAFEEMVWGEWQNIPWVECSDEELQQAKEEWLNGRKNMAVGGEASPPKAYILGSDHTDRRGNAGQVFTTDRS